MKPFPEQSINPGRSFEEELSEIEDRENDRALLADDVNDSRLLMNDAERTEALDYCQQLWNDAVMMARIRGEVG